MFMWPQVGHFDEEFALIDRIAADAPAGVGGGVALARSVTVASSRRAAGHPTRPRPDQMASQTLRTLSLSLSCTSAGFDGSNSAIGHQSAIGGEPMYGLRSLFGKAMWALRQSGSVTTNACNEGSVPLSTDCRQSPSVVDPFDQ